MTNQAKSGRPPAHDLAAFDLTKRSPEQLAQSFAHWKAQRKRSLEEPNQPLQAQPSAVVAKDVAPDPAPADEGAKPSSSKRVKSVEYSATFSELLAAGSEPTVQPADRPPIAARPSLKRARSPGRRLRAMSVLAGAASVLALAGGALLEISDWPRSVEAEPEAAQIEPQQVPAPIAAAATSAPETEWKLQRIVDVALMNIAPSVQAKPKPPTIQTASKAATVESKPTKPTPEKDTPKVEFVAKPFVPAPAAAPQGAVQGAAIPAPPVAAIHTGDPRPDALLQHNRIKSISTNGAVSNRVASGDKPAAAGSQSAVESTSATARAAAARGEPAASPTTGDPRGESSGGARPGIGGEAGGTDADTNGTTDAGGGNTGAADGGSASGGTASGGTASGGTGGSDTGSGSTDGNGAGSSDAGSGGTDDGATGSDGAGGDAGSGEGDSGGSDGEDGDSGGIGGAIGGALDGVGDALGGALGGGGTPDSED